MIARIQKPPRQILECLEDKEKVVLVGLGV